MKYKSLLIRLTAAEFIVTFCMAMSATEAYGCHGVFIGSIVISLVWYIIFLVANGVLG